MKTIKNKIPTHFIEQKTRLSKASLFRNYIYFSPLCNVVILLTFLVCSYTNAQVPKSNSSDLKDYYSLIFKDELISKDCRGKINLPNKYENISSSKEKIFIRFDRELTLNKLSEGYNLIIEKGINEEGMILVNNQVIDTNNNAEKQILSLPKDILIQGNNTISILAINYSGIGSVFDNMYLIDKDGEKIDLKGYWNYSIFNEYVNNFESKPTQTLDISDFVDFEIETSISKNLIDLAWKETDFPISIETLYNDTSVNGVFWFRKKINFEEIPSEDVYISIPKGIDDYDRFYINGHLVGITNCYSCPRNYKVPKEYLLKNNIISILLIDKDGPGGFNDRISIKTSDGIIDISNQWKYQKIYDLQILVALKKNNYQESIFQTTSIDVFNLQGKEIVDNELNYAIGSFVLNNTLLKLVISFLVIITLILMFLKKQKKTKEKIETTDKNDGTDNNMNDKHIMIRANRVNYKIDYLDIIIIESKKDYVKVCLKGSSYLVRNNLKTFLAKLPKNNFVRISKSIAVNLNQIDKIDRNLMYLKSGKYHVIGKRYLDNVKQTL